MQDQENISQSYFINKFENNIKYEFKPYLFKGKYIAKIRKNFTIIQRLIGEEHKSIEYIAKWLRIP